MIRLLLSFSYVFDIFHDFVSCAQFHVLFCVSCPSIKQENEELKDKVKILKKEIEKHVKVLEESEYRSLLERRKLLAKNEKLENDFESQKKLCGRLDAELKEQGYDLIIQKDLLINKEKMIFERDCQIKKRIKMLQELEDRYVLEEKSIMRKKQKVCVLFY